LVSMLMIYLIPTILEDALISEPLMINLSVIEIKGESLLVLIITLVKTVSDLKGEEGRKFKMNTIGHGGENI